MLVCDYNAHTTECEHRANIISYFHNKNGFVYRSLLNDSALYFILCLDVQFYIFYNSYVIAFYYESRTCKTCKIFERTVLIWFLKTHSPLLSILCGVSCEIKSLLLWYDVSFFVGLKFQYQLDTGWWLVIRFVCCLGHGSLKLTKFLWKLKLTKIISQSLRQADEQNLTATHTFTCKQKSWVIRELT